MTTTKLYTLTDIHKLEERYPFKEDELEILIRCHEHLKDAEDLDDFLVKLALASPYSQFFLPGNEMKDRVNWIEDHILPPGFANGFKAAISADAFVEYANQGEDKALERFVEGVADTGRRGVKEALRVIYNIVGAEYASAKDVIDVCFRLAVASDALTVANLDKTVATMQVNKLEPIIESVSESLDKACEGKSLSLNTLTSWAETKFPMLTAPLSTFTHSILFHGHAYPEARIPYLTPKLDHASDIFASETSPHLTALSLTSPSFCEKWHRIYSTESDGRSFNRLEWSLLGYDGPTLLLVKTTDKAIFGAFAATPWKESKDFHGNRDCFLFQLDPKFAAYMAAGGGDNNFMYLHSDYFHSPTEPPQGVLQPHGIGFGGCVENPRIFIPESFEHCSAEFLDRTFESGNLLPPEALEKFEIQLIEVWGVGGDEVISQALRNRAEYRERKQTSLNKAREVHDKSFLAADMKSGLIPNKAFAHQEDVRGRQEYHVDDEHGGYKIELDDKIEPFEK